MSGVGVFRSAVFDLKRVKATTPWPRLSARAKQSIYPRRRLFAAAAAASAPKGESRGECAVGVANARVGAVFHTALAVPCFFVDLNTRLNGAPFGVAT